MKQRAEHSTPSIEGRVVALVITKGTAGGAQTHLLNLLDGLKNEATFHVFVGDEGEMSAKVIEYGMPVHVVPGLANQLNPARDLIALAYLVRAFRRLRPDLVHCHSTKAGALGRVAAALTRIPCVFTVHGWSFNVGISQPRRGAARIAEKLLAFLPATFIAVSEATRQLGISAGISGRHRVITIPNGLVDVAPLGRDAHAGPLVMVMVARFAPGKDHATLLKATSLLATCGDVKILLVGDGPTRQAMEALAMQLGVGHCVEFVGHRTDVDEILRASDVFILSSRHEGLPISILEGMRAGLPVVATDAGGTRELVAHGRNGFLVPPGDARAMARAMSTLITRADIRLRMGAASRDTYLRQFTRDVMVSKIRKAYATMIQERGSRAGPSRPTTPRGTGT